ncbi:MAG: IS5 family transposase [Stellaceae bacterium]
MEIDRLIDWSALYLLLAPIYGSDEGRPSYPVLTLVKLLLLQQWYGLSDPGFEEAVDDRLSFRWFAGLPLDESVPDHSTVWRFRQNLAAHGPAEALFQEINRQLDGRGLIIRKGTLIDATIVKAAVAPPPAKEGTVSERDPQAGWATRNGQSRFGYKAHIAVDEASNLIRDAILTGADLHVSQAVRALIQGDEAAVYADKAYASKSLREALDTTGIADRIMYKAVRNTPLTHWQVWFNKSVSPVRASVECDSAWKIDPS